jgi:hypothetical protein
MKTPYKLVLGLAAIGLGIATVIVPPVAAQSVTKSFTADNGTQAGMLVQLDPQDGGRVKPAERSKPKAAYGVVVLPNDAPLSLTEATNERQVYVATSGSYKLLVSDQNGPIRTNDFIVLSSIDGVGMSADSASDIITGKAVTAFDGLNNVKSEASVKDSTGKQRTVHFGYITASVAVGRNPLYQDPHVKIGIPGALKKVVEMIAGKDVSPIRAYIGLFLAFLTAVIVVAVLTTGIKASITALGRNPLARSSIVRNLLQVMLGGLIILIVGMFGVYLLLKL